jgi:TetR/AcrR family transcriptional regulator, cholesterol catabolism regulator
MHADHPGGLAAGAGTESPGVSPVGGASGPESFGARLRSLRQDRRITLRELGRRLGLSAATMSQIEHGRTGISVRRLGEIADALSVPVVQLITPDAPPVANDTAESGRAVSGRAAGESAGGGERPDKLREAVETARRADGTDWRSYPPLSLGPVLDAALDAFGESGYGGASVRDIASRCGLSVPGLYHHYASKQDMLVELLEIYMDSLLWRTAAARDQGSDPVSRFALIIECLALHHAYRRALAFVGLSEMRSLQQPNRARILLLRNRQQRMADAEAEQAHRAGLFLTPDPHDASRAVVTMCTSIPHWYRPDGPATPEEIARMYVRFALDLMRCAGTRP